MRLALDALGADDDVGEAGVAPERGELRVVPAPPLSVSLGAAAAALAAVRARFMRGAIMFGVVKRNGFPQALNAHGKVEYESMRRLTPELLGVRVFGELLAHRADELLSEGVAVVATALAHDEEEQ